MRNSVLITNALWSLASHTFYRGSLMLSAMMLARYLEASDFAKYSYFQLSISMFAAYAGLGLGVAASRYFAAVGCMENNKEILPLGVLWVLSICLAILASLSILLVPSNMLTAGFAVPRWLFALGVFAVVLQIVPSGAILGLEKYKHSAVVSFFSGICIIIGAFLAIKMDSANIGMIFLILGSMVQFLGESLIVIHVTGWKKLCQFSTFKWSAVREVFSFAGPMFLVSLLASSGTWVLGRIIVKSGDHTFALYVVGMQWFALALVIPGMVSKVILPRVVRNLKTNILDKKMIVRQGAVISTLAALIVFILGVIFSEKIINFYGRGYSDNTWLIAAYMFAAVFIAPANTIGNAIVANGYQKIWLLITVIWFFVLLCTCLLTSSFGAWSGVISQGIAASVLTALSFIFAKSTKLI